MGVYSTVTITRQQAIDMIELALEDATNEELADALFGLTQNEVLDNYCVIGDDNGL